MNPISPFAQRRIRISTLFAVATLLAGGIAGAGGPPGGMPPMPPPAVEVAVVTAKDVNLPEEFVGRVEAMQTVDLKARVSGVLEKIEFAEGGIVRAGDTLLRIEQATYLAQVQVEQAKVERSQAVLEKAGQFLKRLQDVRSGGVSAADLDTAVSSEKQARADLQEAQANLRLAEINLGYTEIKAPIAGTIGKSAFTIGNLVGPESGTLARIVQTDPIRVVFSISENTLVEVQRTRATMTPAELEQLRTVQVQLPGNSLYDLPGQVEFMDNMVDPRTGTIALWAGFANPKTQLLPGQFVTILSHRQPSRKLPVVPQVAVMEDREGRYVFVLGANNLPSLRRIKTGGTTGIDWAVEDGLSVGETIVVQGVQKVKIGLPVTVMPAAAEAK